MHRRRAPKTIESLAQADFRDCTNAVRECMALHRELQQAESGECRDRDALIERIGRGKRRWWRLAEHLDECQAQARISQCSCALMSAGTHLTCFGDGMANCVSRHA